MLNSVIGGIAVSIVNILNWTKLQNKKINFSDYKLYIGFVAMTLLIIVNFYTFNPIIRTLLVIAISTFTIIYIYNTPLRESIILAFFNQTAYVISDVLVIVAVLAITNIQNNAKLAEVFFGTIYANVIISIVVFIIMNTKFIYNLYQKVIQITNKTKIHNTIIAVFGIATIVSTLFNVIYFTNNLALLSCVGLVILLCYLTIIIKSIKIRNNYLNMHIKYNNTLETLKSYEEILDKYKVSNHENKNQLLMIRNMLGKDTKNEVSKYIDKIVENEYKDDENLMVETSKIPAGGLRALIYSKILYMKNKNIKFDIKIDRKIRNVEINSLGENVTLDICKIIGVFLDNAVEEAKKINDGEVFIEIYLLDGKFNISISNNFEGVVDLDKIDQLKYTTKGEGHGYGLSLVKEIINKNSELENVRMINDNVFTQVLKITI